VNRPLPRTLSPEFKNNSFRCLKRELRITSDQKIINMVYLILKVDAHSLNHSKMAPLTQAFSGILQLIFVVYGD